MLELMLKRLIYKLDFIDLNILETIIQYDNIISFPVLVKKLKRINVWDRDIVRRRIKRLKEFKLIYYEAGSNPIIMEVYQHKEEELKLCKELLKQRLIRY